MVEVEIQMLKWEFLVQVDDYLATHRKEGLLPSAVLKVVDVQNLVEQSLVEVHVASVE
jgi:hypothetical protein